MVCEIFEFYRIDGLLKTQETSSWCSSHLLKSNLQKKKKSRLVIIQLQKCDSIPFYLFFEWADKKEEQN